MDSKLGRRFQVGILILLAAVLCFWGGWTLAAKLHQQKQGELQTGMEFLEILDHYDQQLTLAQESLEKDPQGLWFQSFMQENNWGVTPTKIDCLRTFSPELHDFVQACYAQFWLLGEAYEQEDANLSSVVARTAQYCEVGQEVMDYLREQSLVGQDDYLEQAKFVGKNLAENQGIPSTEEPRFIDNRFYHAREEVKNRIPQDLLTVQGEPAGF